MKKNKDYTVSSGNIFADLNVQNPEERLAKAELARQINNLIKQRRLTQVAASELLQIDQPKVSALSNGKLSGFSLERLFMFLNMLGQDITIKITPKTRAKTKGNVIVKATIIKAKTLSKTIQPLASENLITEKNK